METLNITKEEITSSDINTIIAACMLTAAQYDKGELKHSHPKEADRYRTLENKLRSMCYDNKQTLVSISPLERTENKQLKYLNAELVEALKVLADLDLTGVTGEIVYQRNKTKINVTDITNAKKILSKVNQ